MVFIKVYSSVLEIKHGYILVCFFRLKFKKSIAWDVRLTNWHIWKIVTSTDPWGTLTKNRESLSLVRGSN